MGVRELHDSKKSILIAEEGERSYQKMRHIDGNEIRALNED